MRDEKFQVKYSINMKTFTAEYHRIVRPCYLGLCLFFFFFELLILCEVFEVKLDLRYK